MNPPLLTIFACPGAHAADRPGLQRIDLPSPGARHLDAALPAAAAPVAVRLGPGEALAPDAVAAAAAAAGQAHRAWWWAAEDRLAKGSLRRRCDLLSLLLHPEEDLPVTLFRPRSALALGGFARHRGPAFAWADACDRLARGLAPGRVEGPLVRPAPGAAPGAAGGPRSAGPGGGILLDRLAIADRYADHAAPADRDRVWARCAAVRGGVSSLRRAA